MEHLFGGLNKKNIHDILVAAGDRKRKEPFSGTHKLQEKYSKRANQLLQSWKKSGVPHESFVSLKSSQSNLVDLFALQHVNDVNQSSSNSLRQDSSTNFPERAGDHGELNADYGPIDETVVIVHAHPTEADFFTASDTVQALLPSSTPMESYDDSTDEQSEDEFEGTAVFDIGDKAGGLEETMTFVKLLRHWSTFTLTRESHISYFLRLLKHYKPVIDYSVLPSTGKTLLYIDGRDFDHGSHYPSTDYDLHSEEDRAESEIVGSTILGTLQEPYLSQSSEGDISSEHDNSSEDEDWISCGSNDDLGDDPESASAIASANLPQSKRKRNRYPLPKAAVLPNGGGKLMYFGLERALSCDSPGIMFRHADILQYVNIYSENINLLPQCIRDKVESLDVAGQIQKAKSLLKNVASEPPCAPASPHRIPHYNIDLNIDGVQLFNNTETMEFIPILVVVHSIQEDFESEIPPRLLNPSYPIIVGYFHGKHKPPAKQLMKQLVRELHRLSPKNNDTLSCTGRQFTATLRCVRTDGPMRSYLKRIKGHSGYWSCERCIQPGKRFYHGKKKKETAKTKKKELPSTIQFRELNAPPREDHNFLKYCKSKDCDDEHLLNLNDLSPFLEIDDFPIITGFVIDSMHTLTAGCFGRRLEGIAKVASEGKIGRDDLNKVNSRLALFEGCKPFEFDRHVRNFSKCVSKYKHHELRQFLYYLLFPVFNGILKKEPFEHILLLQQAMLLLGGFSPNPVPQSDIDLASELLKKYVETSIKLGYPIRFTDHESTHVPEDSKNFECGVECLSAYVFENFQRFFRSILRSGHLPVEQIRNRLMERSKYLLPTGPDGLILTNFQHFQIEAAKIKMKQNPGNILIEFTNNSDGLQEMRFPTFSLSNQFPDNVCLLKNGSVVVCVGMVEYPESSKVYLITGYKFGQLDDCYTEPFLSSRFHIYIASKISQRLSEWNINNISGKMYPTPYKYDGQQLPSLCDEKQKWNVTPLFHTVH